MSHPFQSYLSHIHPEELAKALDDLLLCLVIAVEKENLFEGELINLYEAIRELRNAFIKQSDAEKLVSLWK